MYLKADIILKLTINASPFSSGKFLLLYSPYEKDIDKSLALLGNSFTGISAYPHVAIDLQLDTNVEMRIPFLEYKEAYNMTDQLPLDYCTVFLMPLTPLRNISNTSPISINLFAHFDNITLAGPTTQPLSKIYGSLQIKTEKGKGILEEVATGVAGVAGSLTKVPVLATIARPVQWFANAVAQVSSIFGFSRPSANLNKTPMVNAPTSGFCHISNIDTTNSLALNQDYGLGMLDDVFQTKLDEMDIAYVCANPAVYACYPWNSGAGSNFSQVIPLTPIYEEYSDNLTNDTKTLKATPLPYQYIASFFRYSRCTYCIKISVAKTAFHRGRLEIIFDPYHKLTNLLFTEGAEDMYRVILDLTNDTEITVKIPFIFNKLFFDREVDDRMGNLIIRELNRLVNPSTVNSTVDVVVWQWIENPIFTLFQPKSFQKTATFASMQAQTQIISGSLQILLSDAASSKVVVFGKMGDEVQQNLEALSKANGDACFNLRALSRSFWYMDTFQKAKSTSYEFMDINFKDVISYISPLYRFYRGGLRYKFAIKSNNCPALGCSLATVGNIALSPYHFTYYHINPILEVSVPFNVPARRMVMGATFNYYQTPAVTLTQLASEVTSSEIATVYRAADDDFSLGWLVGPPIINITDDAQPF